MTDENKSRLIDAEAAQKLANGARSIGDVLAWRIYDRSTTHSPRFIARPILAGTMVPVHLEAPTLEALREQLPHGLRRLARSAALDPEAIESWV